MICPVCRARRLPCLHYSPEGRWVVVSRRYGLLRFRTSAAAAEWLRRIRPFEGDGDEILDLLRERYRIDRETAEALVAVSGLDPTQPTLEHAKRFAAHLILQALGERHPARRVA